MKRFGMPIMWVLLLLVVVSLIVGRAFWESRKFYRHGTESLSKGELHTAIIYFGRAAKWYLPLNPYVDRSLTSLWETANRAEEIGETDFALKALYTLRGSVYGTTWLFTPHQEWLEPCNQRIANVLTTRHPHLTKEEVLTGLHHQMVPRTGWALLAVMGFWGWVVATLGLIWFSFDSSGIMRSRKAAWWGAVTLAFFLFWILGMYRA